MTGTTWLWYLCIVAGFVSLGIFGSQALFGLSLVSILFICLGFVLAKLHTDLMKDEDLKKAKRVFLVIGGISLAAGLVLLNSQNEFGSYVRNAGIVSIVLGCFPYRKFNSFLKESGISQAFVDAIPESEGVKKSKAEQYFTYNSFTNSIKLKRKSPEIKNAITIEAAREVFANYTPDKLLYTSATVGGVTTGGVDVIKGGYSITSGQKTGKYYLSYKYAIDAPSSTGAAHYWSGLVSFIELSNEELEEVKKHPVLKNLIATDKTKDLFHLSGKNALDLISIPQSTAQSVLNWLAGE